MHIGICDDEENVRAYIRKLIEQQNEECQITEYASGEELLQAEKENSEKIDVLFLDIAMGDIDGMSVAKQLRQIQADKGQSAFAYFCDRILRVYAGCVFGQCVPVYSKADKEKGFCECLYTGSAGISIFDRAER